MPDRHFIRASYRHRAVPSYFSDDLHGVVAQPDVYAHAALIARELNVRRIVDVGCGTGGKLIELSTEFEIVGIDYGSNIAACRARHRFGDWREHNLESDGSLPVSSAEASDALIICSDVVEHLIEPRNLLAELARLGSQARAVVISTPERDLTRGLKHGGPPQNECHVREWSIREFALFAEETGMGPFTIGLSRSNDSEHALHTILLAALRNREELRVATQLIIDHAADQMPNDQPGLALRIRLAARMLLRGY